MVKIERILCPTDLSPQSDEGLRYAIALARAFEAKLYVCHYLNFMTMVGGETLERVFVDSIAGHLNRLRKSLRMPKSKIWI